MIKRQTLSTFGRYLEAVVPAILPKYCLVYLYVLQPLNGYLVCTIIHPGRLCEKKEREELYYSYLNLMVQSSFWLR